MQLPSTGSSPAPEFTVRPPTREDADRMAELAEQLGYPCTGRQLQSRLDVMGDSKNFAVYVVGAPGGPIAGWIGLFMFRTVETDGYAEISGLVVDQGLRSRGIGKLLLEAAETWARGQGCDGISVRSNIKRDRAHAFYKRNGYRWMKTQESFRKAL